MSTRVFVSDLKEKVGQEVVLRGWTHRLRELAKTSFVILKDCSGPVQCVGAPAQTQGLGLKLDDAIEIKGRVRAEARSKQGFEVDILEIRVLNAAAENLPFHASTDISAVGPDVLLEHRPLAVRNERVGDIFRVQAKIVEGFRDYLRRQRFTEIITSKIVASGTEGGTNLFQIKYFDQIAYLAQSPQFYKEHGVAGFERVFEAAHVYRAEPHASSRHLTEYYSLDLEFGFIDGVEDVMQLERELLSDLFANLTRDCGEILARFNRPALPSMLGVPAWEFDECLKRLKSAHGRTDLIDDLDPEAERQLCALAEKENGIPAVFVVGFPLSGRPFYTHPRGATGGGANSFDLLFHGLEITTGGQRLHRRVDLENALRTRGIDPAGFESHLRMFDLGMPPHGGLAIGLERLTAQILGLPNVREATLYPRDRYRITP
jgi:nondiscriminating aspartyl-tRNA synthetase